MIESQTNSSVHVPARTKEAVISVGAIIVAAAAAWLLGKSLLLGGALVVGGLIGGFVAFTPIAGLTAILGSLILGQLIRIPVGEGAILPNDILVPAFLAAWFLRSLYRRRVALPSSPLSWPIAVMITLFILTFLAGALRVPFLTDRELAISSLYIARWVEYALLTLVVADMIRSETIARRVFVVLAGCAMVVALLGFVQLKFFPDFTFMVPEGWDPHVGRLLSTWFDPNFLAGFLTFIICVVGGVASQVGVVRRVPLLIVMAVLAAALVLTFSRSGYAAFAAGIVVLTFLRSKRMLLVLILASATLIVTVPRVQERIQGALSLDETAKLRLVSWENALTVVRDYPLTGIGYNTYRYVQVTYGFQTDASEHSAGGSDSSLLTILVTTGPFGLAAYLWLLWVALTVAWSAYRRGLTEFERGLGVGVLAATVSVIVHSFFINSLLFPHMLEVIAISFGLLVGLRQQRLGVHS